MPWLEQPPHDHGPATPTGPGFPRRPAPGGSRELKTLLTSTEKCSGFYGARRLPHRHDTDSGLRALIGQH